MLCFSSSFAFLAWFYGWYIKYKCIQVHDMMNLTLVNPQNILSFCSPWWRHQMEAFFAVLAICAGNSPVPGEFPAQWPATRSFDVFFDQHPSNRLSKQWRGWWFETLSYPLWRHRNAITTFHVSHETYVQYIPRIRHIVVPPPCFAMVWCWSLFTHIFQGRFTGTEAIMMTS